MDFIIMQRWAMFAVKLEVLKNWNVALKSEDLTGD
jgi:hypothetical protein